MFRFSVILHFLSWIPVNSSPPGAAYMRQQIESALVQIMACHLLGAKPLSKPMLSYCQLDPYKQISVKFQSKYKTFHPGKRIWKYCLRNDGQFVQGEMTYRNWYQDWGHCGVTNDLESSPQPFALGLWWAIQVVGDTTMTEIEVSISILSWCLKSY